MKPRGSLVLAIVSLTFLLATGATADSMYVTASEVHIRANYPSYVIFRVNRLHGLNLTYRYYTGLPMQSERDGEVNNWPDKWLTSMQLRLTIPVDVARRLVHLKEANPTLAKAYSKTDIWLLKLSYELPEARPELAPPQPSSTWFDTLKGWVDYISTVDKISDLAQKYGDQLLGTISPWLDVIGEVLCDNWEWLLALFGL